MKKYDEIDSFEFGQENPPKIFQEQKDSQKISVEEEKQLTEDKRREEAEQSVEPRLEEGGFWGDPQE